MSLTRRLPAYGEKFTQQLLEAVRKHDGLILVAEHDNRPIGFIAGIIYERTKEELLEATPARSGRVLELFVIQEYRDHKIGMALMERMEDYFRRKKCNVCRVEVFNPNKMAYRFYQALGYQNRMIDLIKVLREND
ncbi:MAG: GNAT family N-acetyltransferase [Candidatus Hodarchaeota archaeon]